MNNPTMNLFIEPLDVWLFRNGRPFNAEEDHTAQGIFPPLPSTMQGILRTHHLAQSGVNIHDKKKVKAQVGTRDNYPDSFQLTGPFIASRKKDKVVRYFPLPQDLYFAKELDAYTTFVPQLAVDIYTDLLTNETTNQLQLLSRRQDQDPEKGETEGGVWLAETVLTDYLQGKSIPKTKTTAGSTLFTTETRVGIGLDSARRATCNGRIYEVKFTRPQTDVGLTVGITGLDGWSNEGVIALGGEARAGHYWATARWQPPQGNLPNPTQFKVLFLTPTYFAEGWCSQDWQQFFVGQVQLVATAVGRPIIWGGRDLAQNNIHEPSYRYVPAGSVYYFRGQPECKLPYITDEPDKFGPIGFGQFAIGGW